MMVDDCMMMMIDNDMSDDIYTSLPKARAAATKAVAKYDMLQS